VIQTRDCNWSSADARRKRGVLPSGPNARRNAVTAHSGRSPGGFRPPFAAPKGQPTRLPRIQDRNAARIVRRFTLKAQPMQLPRFQSRERSRGCAGCRSPRAALQKRSQQFVMFRRRRWHARDRALRTRDHRMAGHAVRRRGHAPAIRRCGRGTIGWQATLSAVVAMRPRSGAADEGPSDGRPRCPPSWPCARDRALRTRHRQKARAEVMPLCWSAAAIFSRADLWICDTRLSLIPNSPPISFMVSSLA